MNAVNKWHFPRPDLAHKYLAILDSGLTQIIALSSPRRTGKTEFVTHDFMSAVKDRGSFTYYIDFLESEGCPEERIVSSILRGFQNLPLSLKLKSESLKEFNAGVSRVNESIENPAITTINQALMLIRQIHQNDTAKVVMIFDEVQCLATKPRFEKVARALRTFIDKNKQWLSVVFTGSSKNGLKRLFSRKKSAFYYSVFVLDFPLLGAAYVHHTIKEFNYISPSKIHLSAAFRVFKKVNRNPGEFSKLIQVLLCEKSGDIEGCLNRHSINSDQTCV